MPRLSGRIAGFASALLVVGVLLIPAADARPEVGSQPGAAGERGDADRTVARAYRVIAPAYEVNSRGVGYAVWVEQDGNSVRRPRRLPGQERSVDQGAQDLAAVLLG